MVTRAGSGSGFRTKPRRSLSPSVAVTVTTAASPKSAPLAVWVMDLVPRRSSSSSAADRVILCATYHKLGVNVSGPAGVKVMSASPVPASVTVTSSPVGLLLSLTL